LPALHLAVQTLDSNAFVRIIGEKKTSKRLINARLLNQSSNTFCASQLLEVVPSPQPHWHQP